MGAILWLLALCCGCNEVFGLRQTIAIDAQQFDAPADAPYACPPPGAQPMFAALLYQVIAQNCISYTTSATTNRAAAYCLDIDAIADGVIDGVPEKTVMTPEGNFDWPRLTPEGDEMWVRRRDGTGKIAVYGYTSEHQWTWIRDLALASTGVDDIITTPSRRVDGVRHFLHYAFSERTLYEYTDDGATQTFVRAYDATALGIYFVQFPNLNADGLRLVFVGQGVDTNFAQTFYADRAQLADPFVAALPLTTAPVAYDPFLTADCSRLYTSGLGSIFYARQ